MTTWRRASAAALIALAAAGLAALVVHDGRLNWALENAPAEAVRIDPSDPRALAAAADAALAKAKTAGELQAAAGLARRAVARSPIEAGAVRDLGLVEAERGDIGGADRILSAAGALTPQDDATHVWLMMYRLLTADYAGGFRDADDVIRHRPDLLERLTPELVAHAGPGVDALVTRLATAPPWRGAFLESLARRAAPATTMTILTGLKARGPPPENDAVSAYLARRVAEGAYTAAYLDWLQLLPPGALAQAGALYDGGFRGLPGAPPFNWTLDEGQGGEADISGPGGGAGALHVSYDGYSEPGLAAQLLVLQPGAWRLSGRVRTSGGAPEALAWTLTCADAAHASLARSVAPSAPAGWRAFAVAFQVPAQGCEGQWLRLIPVPGDRERPLEAWFADLAVTRG